MAILLSACIFSGCSFMDLKWDTASSDLKISGASNNATAEAYYDAYGNKLGITLSIYLVSSTIVIPSLFP